jgi:hypothetical protein
MSASAPADLDRNAWGGLVLKQAARLSKRAAPFFKGTRGERPKKPGRKPGQGPLKRREAPQTGDLSKPPVVEPRRPKRGGELVLERGDDSSSKAIIKMAYQNMEENIYPKACARAVEVGRRTAGVPRRLMVFETERTRSLRLASDVATKGVASRSPTIGRG